MTERYSPISLVRHVLKLDPWRMKKLAAKKPARACHKPQTAFFALPPDVAFSDPRPPRRRSSPVVAFQMNGPMVRALPSSCRR